MHPDSEKQDPKRRHQDEPALASIDQDLILTVESRRLPSLRRKSDIGVLDAAALTIAMKHLDELEIDAGRKFSPDARAAAVAGLYLALMRDRAAGIPDPE